VKRKAAIEEAVKAKAAGGDRRREMFIESKRLLRLKKAAIVKAYL